jgi:myo-inositol-1(or 4)-monophosphatase
LRAIEPVVEPALRELAVEAVREAGALALASFGKPLSVRQKANDSPVSDADLAVDAFLRRRLMAATPSYGWLSEESVDEPARLAARRVWIVDPIDGTRAFIGARPDWVVSVGLVECGRPILAALIAPVEGSLFLAVAGGGATCNGAPIRASDGTALEGASVAGPRRLLDALAALVPVRPVPKVNSLALRLARVAQGAIDVAFASGSGHDWDLAAADLLVHEAGGVLTTLGGERPRYNQVATSHGALVGAGIDRHSVLIDLVAARRDRFA